MQNQNHLPSETPEMLSYSPPLSAAEWETAPYATRMEIRREIAQHLDSLAQAYQEMGDDPVLATDKALVKFGEPEKVARQWKPLVSSTRHKLSMRRWFGKQWQGIASTLTVCSVAGVVFAMSRPVLSPTTFQVLAPSVSVNQEAQTTMTVSPYHHNGSTFNAPCTSCHISTAQFTTPARTLQFAPSRIIAPK